MDSAVHVAFTALGISVTNHLELAYRLNDFITQEFGYVVSDDGDDDEVLPSAETDTPSDTASGVGGQGND